MLDRFQSTDVGSELLRRADVLRVSMFRNDDGGVSSSFELQGNAILDDEEGDPGAVDREGALQFLRQLMAAFEKA